MSLQLELTGEHLERYQRLLPTKERLRDLVVSDLDPILERANNHEFSPYRTKKPKNSYADLTPEQKRQHNESKKSLKAARMLASQAELARRAEIVKARGK